MTSAEAGRPPGRDGAPGRASAVVRAVWTLPQRLIILLLIAYRAVVSPLYGQVCRFFPSCSAYALEAITVHGAVRGSYLAARRLLRCHPWNSGGLDPVPEGHRHWPEDRVPRIVVLNHPDRYWTDGPDNGNDSAATTRGM
ncbi:membrane protein insertion efficiency factor YidD [Sinomonas mesophila]|uniref:membrane protein insertion efficiency factor YidD n=1 Tax=Sinomonas mesophila TaxID=1531955 RepID=UPI000985C493|nr:membrane protein insertion efficiency factor YidD [Sinomonas mesophila]